MLSAHRVIARNADGPGSTRADRRMTTNQSRLATALSSRRQSILVLDDDDASGVRESLSIGWTERRVVLAASCILG